MIKRFCDKCGREIGNKKGMGVKLFPLDDSHESDFIDLCSDCQWKFVEWMHGLNSKDTKVIYIKSEDDFPNGPLADQPKEEEAPEKIKRVNDNLDDLELSVRAYNVLLRYLNKGQEHRYGIEIGIEEVCDLTLSDLYGMRGLGKKSIEEIVQKLAERGLKLREEAENKPVDVSGLTWD